MRYVLPPLPEAAFLPMPAAAANRKLGESCAKPLTAQNESCSLSEGLEESWSEKHTVCTREERPLLSKCDKSSRHKPGLVMKQAGEDSSDCLVPVGIVRQHLGDQRRQRTSEIFYKCPRCGEIFHERNKFLKHQQCRTARKPCVCQECGRKFFWRSDLTRHRKTHTGEKPHSCLVCGKSFLARHHRIHTGEKPYGCSQCGRSFRQRTHLVRHQRIHTGELFQCTECGKGFSQRDTLKRHQRTHRTLLRPASSEGGESSNRGSMFAVQAPAIPVPVAIFPLGVASIRPQNGIELKKLSESP
uniref:C2H2-type domain-containing protein n=1 Tax=Podarcis muralis TaxID=64176 RepID=A0A670HM44_PODMU